MWVRDEIREPPRGSLTRAVGVEATNGDPNANTRSFAWTMTIPTETLLVGLLRDAFTEAPALPPAAGPCGGACALAARAAAADAERRRR